MREGRSQPSNPQTACQYVEFNTLHLPLLFYGTAQQQVLSTTTLVGCWTFSRRIHVRDLTDSYVVIMHVSTHVHTVSQRLRAGASPFRCSYGHFNYSACTSLPVTAGPKYGLYASE